MWAVAPEKANIVIRKLKDVFVLALLGLAVLVSVGLSVAATAMTHPGARAGWASRTAPSPRSFLRILGIAAGAGWPTPWSSASCSPGCPGHKLPWKNVLSGAVLGAVGIEILKVLGATLI